MYGNHQVEQPSPEEESAYLRVVAGSPFLSIQGEGPFTGQPAIFIRFHGCNLRCYFCDTEFSQPTDPTVHVHQLLVKVNELARTSPGCKLVVLTGGEPTLQPLGLLVRELNVRGYEVQVETNGTIWREWLTGTHVVVAPKTPKIHPNVEKVALAYKYTISSQDAYSMVDGLPILRQQGTPTGPPLARPRLDRVDWLPHGKATDPAVYLYPRDEHDPVKNSANAHLTAQRAIRFGYICGLQIHKYLGIQ